MLAVNVIAAATFLVASSSPASTSRSLARTDGRKCALPTSNNHTSGVRDSPWPPRLRACSASQRRSAEQAESSARAR
jgi:hypothetical protein